MPSTYTLNNGIELIATGEQSGTWGDTTNTNLSLVLQIHWRLQTVPHPMVATAWLSLTMAAI
ncbi:MAG: hypothetical protein ACYTBY_09665 [Planctomycetota bacterium]